MADDIFKRTIQATNTSTFYEQYFLYICVPKTTIHHNFWEILMLNKWQAITSIWHRHTHIIVDALKSEFDNDVVIE